MTQTADDIEEAAFKEAVNLYMLQEQRGVPQVTTSIAAAMLAGQIIGLAAEDEEHAQAGLDQLIAVMRCCASDWLHGRDLLRARKN